MWLPTAQYYREHFQNYKIHLIVNENIASLFSILPFWDEIIPLQGKSFKNTYHKKNYFDLIINTQFSRTYDSDLFISSLNGSKKICSDSSGPNYPNELLKKGNSFYSKILVVEKTRKHELERNFELLNLCIMKEIVPSLESVKNMLLPDTSNKLNIKKYLVILPGASWQKRSYPWPRFLDLIQEIKKERPDISIVLCGGSEDKIIAHNICNNTKIPIFNFCGQLSLLETLAMISKAELVVSNDSMGAHAAVILNKKLVCIMGGGYTSKDTRHGRFFPYPSKVLAGWADQTVLNYYLDCYDCANLCIYGNLVRDCIPCVDYIPKNDLIRSVIAQI